MPTKRARHTFTEDDAFAALFPRVRQLYKPTATDAEVVRDLAVRGAMFVLESGPDGSGDRRRRQHELLAYLQRTYDAEAAPGAAGAEPESFAADDWDED